MLQYLLHFSSSCFKHQLLSCINKLQLQALEAAGAVSGGKLSFSMASLEEENVTDMGRYMQLVRTHALKRISAK